MKTKIIKAKSFKHLFLLLIIAFLPIALYAQERAVKNVIFMIGDGMGLHQIYAAMVKNGSLLNIESIKTIGFSKTYSANQFTTDSGAGGTALACGVKTNNGMIGMSADSIAQPSIMEFAKKAGLSTGLVVTCNVTHATPASFVAHQVSRKNTQEIAADYLKSDIDVFIGGGKNDFEKRKDNRNISQELETKNYKIVYTLEDLQKIEKGKIGALLAGDHLAKQSEGRADMLSISTKKALDILSQNENGFFLMIEGSQIDWGSHKNNIDYVVSEMLDFDKAIGVALDFARKNANTLLIITADHECGGLTIPDGNIGKNEIEAKFSTFEHTGTPVPVFSFGTGAELFSGFMENTSFFGKLIKLYGF